MSKSALDYFGKFLMERVRDKAILELDMTVDGRMKDAESREIQGYFSQLNEEEKVFIMKLIPKAVDATLHHLLWALEQEMQVDISVNASSETVSRLQDVSDGFPGELYTEDGWIMRFSKERYEERT